MQKGSLLSFEDVDPHTPLALSNNSSFDSSFVSMAKFVEYTNVPHTDDHKILHPAVTAKFTKSASEFVKELSQLVSTNVEANRRNVKAIQKLLDEIAIYFATGAFSDVSLDNPYSGSATTVSLSASHGVSMSPTMSSFFNILLQLFSIDDKKVHDLTHYFVTEMNLSDPDREQLVKVLKRELTQKNIVSRTFCLRTLDRVVRTDPKRTHSDILFTCVKDVLAEYGKPESFVEKKGLTSLLNVGSKEKINKLNLLKMTLQVITNNPDFGSKPLGLEFIVNVARNKDLVCSREAIAALSAIAQYGSNKSQVSASVLNALSQYLPKYNIEASKRPPQQGGFAYSKLEPLKKSDTKKSALLPQLNTEDVHSKFHMCSLCSLVVKVLKLPTKDSPGGHYSDETEEGGVHDDKFVEFLKYLAHDENLIVFFEVVKQTSLRNFSFFLQKDINQQSGSILDFVIKRLCNSLSKNKPQAQIHAACKAAQYLLTAYTKFTTYCTLDPYTAYPPDSVEMKQCRATFLRLYDSIDELLAYDCCFIRLEAFKAMLWREDTVESVVKLLKMEVKSNTVWMPFHIHELMFTLLRFSRVQFAIFDHFADFASFICIYLSERVDLDLLISLFKSVIPEKDTPKRQQIASKFLQMMFHILDNCLTGSKESVQLSFILYSFLGDVANKLTGEPRDERDLPPHPNRQKMDPKDIFERSEMFDIQNGAMKAIILRLVHNCMYNTPQIRTACTEALAKIAFRSLGSVRLFIYEVFQYLAQMPALGLSAQALGMIQVLDEVYRLQQQLVKLLYKQPTDVEIMDFFDQHEQLKKKISFFTRVPPSFLVVGRASQALLAKGHELKYHK